MALEHARDEFNRLNGRLSLLETKSQLTAAVAGLLLGFLGTILGSMLSSGVKPNWLAVATTAVALVVSLVAAVIASVVTEVDAPTAAEDIATQSATLMGTTGAPDSDKAEGLLRELCMSYVAAAKSAAGALTYRAGRLLVSQVTLLIGLVLFAVLIVIPWVGYSLSEMNNMGAGT